MVTVLLRCCRVAYTSISINNGNLRERNTSQILVASLTRNWNKKFNFCHSYPCCFYSSSKPSRKLRGLKQHYDYNYNKKKNNNSKALVPMSEVYERRFYSY